MTTRRRSKQMCYVEVGFTHLLMPSDEGMRLVKLLENAVQCESNFGYGADEIFTPSAQPRVSFRLVNQDQINMRSGEASHPHFRQPLGLGHSKS